VGDNQSIKNILIPDPSIYEVSADVQAYFSLEPYYSQIKKRLEEPGQPFGLLYRHILQEFEKSPELLSPVSGKEIIDRNQFLFQLVISTIFPFSTDTDVQYFSLGTPYKFEIFFYSKSFSDYFNPDEKGYVRFPPERPFEQIQHEYLLMAYRMIFRRFYQTEIRVPERRTNRWLDKSTGLYRYSRLHIDESFVDVRLLGDLPPFPKDVLDKVTGSIADLETLKQLVPLKLFRFEGFFFRRSIIDVTLEECITHVKNALIEMQSHEPEPGYLKLISAVETLVGLKDVKISLSPFLRLNDRYVFYNGYSGRSWLLSSIHDRENKERVYNHLAMVLNREKGPMIMSDVYESGTNEKDETVLRFVQKTNARSYIILPLFHEEQLIGMVEAVATEDNLLNNTVLKKLEPVYAFFEMACRNYHGNFRNEIESLVKERFTALQPIVEWKFLEEAWAYLRQMDIREEPELGTVRFDQIFPIYGAVDIRNSSTERSRCIQQDLLEHLDFIAATINKFGELPQKAVNQHLDYLLKRGKVFRSRIEEALHSEDESVINEYLDKEVKVFFKHLAASGEKNTLPAQNYIDALEGENNILFQNRRKFEESVIQLNQVISKYLESEREKIQRYYPHYFEKFRTDGVEYNIYIGESFTPMKTFDNIFLKNIRLWQLSTMAEVTRLTHRIHDDLPLPLQTTQLILLYGTPICISFRKDERRFDVEGIDSIRYEILKKRLDKARVKSTGERLTQPNTIAIVYMQEKDVPELEEYYGYLNNNGLLKSEKEWLDLEDVQGVSGIKALRLHVNLDGQTVNKKEFSIQADF
jgi:hypothetical protein